jgi:hypothetical protein
MCADGRSTTSHTLCLIEDLEQVPFDSWQLHTTVYLCSQLLGLLHQIAKTSHARGVHHAETNPLHDRLTIERQRVVHMPIITILKTHLAMQPRDLAQMSIMCMPSSQLLQPVDFLSQKLLITNLVPVTHGSLKVINHYQLICLSLLRNSIYLCVI